MEKRGIEIAVEVPVSVREALGDKATLDLITWLSKLIPPSPVTRNEFNEVILRLDSLEKDLRALREELVSFKDSVDKRFESVDKRFEAVNARIDSVHDRIDALRKDVDDRIDALNGRFDSFQRSMETRLDLIQDRMLVQARWFVGSIAILGTVISILLAIGQFVR